MLDKIIQVLEDDIVKSQGCTEPIALAYAASVVTDALGTTPEEIDVYLSGNLIKNIKSVIIPSSGGMFGIEQATAMGVLLGDKDKELMVISQADQSRLGEVKAYARSGKIRSHAIDENAQLHIRVIAKAGNDTALVEIKDAHTNIIKLEKNGKAVSIAKKENKSGDSVDASFLNMRIIYDLTKNLDISKVERLFSEVAEVNTLIAEEGLRGGYGGGVGKTIYEGIKEGHYEDNVKNNIMGYAAAASDARMNGVPMAVMSACGSGNQGITASLPVVRYCQIKKCSKEDLIKALFFSHITLVYLKEHVGKLSTFCGAVCGGASSNAAIAFLEGMSYEKICTLIETVIGTQLGMICDGAKSSCATKISSAIGMGYDAKIMAMKDRGFQCGEGVVGKDIESTLNNMHKYISEGLNKTDAVVLDIMLSNDC